MRLSFFGHVAIGWIVYNACPMDRVSSWCHINCPSRCPLLCSETISTFCTTHHTSPGISLRFLYPYYLHAPFSLAHFFLFSLFFVCGICVQGRGKPWVSFLRSHWPCLLLLFVFFPPRPVDDQLGCPHWPASPELWVSASPILGL